MSDSTRFFPQSINLLLKVLCHSLQRSFLINQQQLSQTQVDPNMSSWQKEDEPSSQLLPNLLQTQFACFVLEELASPNLRLIQSTNRGRGLSPPSTLNCHHSLSLRASQRACVIVWKHNKKYISPPGLAFASFNLVHQDICHAIFTSFSNISLFVEF